MELAFHVVEVEAVHRYQLRYQLVPQLIFGCLERAVAEDEASLLHRVRMEIEVEEGAVVAKESLSSFEELLNHPLGGEDRRLSQRVWIPIVPVQVLVEGVLSVVTSVDAIWVKARYDLKNKVVSE